MHQPSRRNGINAAIPDPHRLKTANAIVDTNGALLNNHVLQINSTRDESPKQATAITPYFKTLQFTSHLPSENPPLIDTRDISRGMLVIRRLTTSTRWAGCSGSSLSRTRLSLAAGMASRTPTLTDAANDQSRRLTGAVSRRSFRSSAVLLQYWLIWRAGEHL
jgi:hypothetical protein